MVKILKNKVFYIILTLILIDQLTKVAMLTFVSSGYKEIIQGILQLEMAQNTGIAFGIMQNSNLGMIFTTLIVLIVVSKFYIFQNKNLDRKMRVALPLILAGGISNLIDRVCRGYVVDYVYIEHLPIFNLADIYVVIGWVLFALSMAIYTGKELGNIRNVRNKEENSNERRK